MFTSMQTGCSVSVYNSTQGAVLKAFQGFRTIQAKYRLLERCPFGRTSHVPARKISEKQSTQRFCVELRNKKLERFREKRKRFCRRLDFQRAWRIGRAKQQA